MADEGKIGERILVGAIAGIAGTLFMTLAARRLFRLLPGREKYPLPPREITEVVVGSDAAKDRRLAVQTLAAHFSYGAACGVIFTLAGMHGRRPIRKGMGWGAAVWAASYLGILPGLRVLKPATRHPIGRNAVMIAVHFVWGGGLGFVTRALSESMELFMNRDGRILADTAQADAPVK